METLALGFCEGLLGARGNPGDLVVSAAPQDMCGLYFSGISQKYGGGLWLLSLALEVVSEVGSRGIWGTLLYPLECSGMSTQSLSHGEIWDSRLQTVFVGRRVKWGVRSWGSGRKGLPLS